jgi:hypothetical protein
VIGSYTAINRPNLRAQHVFYHELVRKSFFQKEIHNEIPESGWNGTPGKGRAGSGKPGGNLKSGLIPRAALTRE